MKIGINGYEAIVSRVGYEANTNLPIRVGSGQYVFELLKAVYEANKLNKTDKFLIYLPCSPTSDLPKESDDWQYKIVPKKTLWTLVDLSWEFFFGKEKLDVFFSPTHYLPLYCPHPSVISIMDLSYLYFPELFKPKDLWQLRLWTKYSIGKAKKVLTISCASKNDIIKYYRVAENKVAVTYPGVKVSSMSNTLEKYQITKPYILFVGTLQPRKNIGRLIEAFAMILGEKKDSAHNIIISQYPNIELVIIGRQGWMYEEILAAPKKFGLENKVKFLSEITSEELPAFYKNALCFILPSLYEGFGLPVLEAMQYGCPVITSNVSSLPEAGGEAALYVNPENVEDIKEKIEMVISEEKLRNEMIKKGFAQVKKFSWEKTAKETLKVLEEVAKTK